MDTKIEILSRLQFGLTASFHILFPCLIIGLVFYLVILEYLWLRTGNRQYRIQYEFWVRPFAVVLILGMVTGVALAFQLDTTFRDFYYKTSSILLPIRHVELTNAIVFEAGALGVMLFGWNRVGDRLHFSATVMMVVGVVVSGVCINARNSWMQTPDGYFIKDGQILLEDWLSVIVNPSFPFRFSHMVSAAILSTAFFVMGLSAWFLIKGKYRDFAKYNLRFALLTILIMAPAQLLLGHFHGVNTNEYQPVKVAAMEALWETQKGAPMVLFAWPDQEAERNRYAVEIPYLASLIVTHHVDGELEGLKAVPKSERPNVPIVFVSFRIMVAIGMLMIVTGMVGGLLLKKGRLYQSRYFLRVCVAMIPSGFIATIAGWCVTEAGRQPWTVTGLVKTSEIIATETTAEVTNFLSFVGGFYLLLVVVFLYSFWRFIRRGPALYPAAELGELITEHERSVAGSPVTRFS